MWNAVLLSWYIAAQAADVTTSLMLPAPYYREVNPLVPERPVPLITLKAGVTTGVCIYGWKIRKKHPKAAAFMFIAGAVSGTIAASINVRTIQRRR